MTMLDKIMNEYVAEETSEIGFRWFSDIVRENITTG